MNVVCPGALLSSLFYEHASADSDQEGFLLGKVVSHVTDTISDTQINNRKEETVTYINSYIPCMPSFSWYDSSGDIDMESLDPVLADHKKDVVGWYRSRRNSTLRVSLRESSVHKCLAACFPGISQSHFVLLLRTPYMSANMATHTYDHKVFSYTNSAFLGLPLDVVNLKDTSHSEYKLHSHHAVTPNAGIYSSCIAQASSQFLDNTGRLQSVSGLQSMGCHLQNQLKDLCNSVKSSENELAILAAEVDSLHEQLNPPLPLLLPPQPVPVLNKLPTLPTTTTLSMLQKTVPVRNVPPAVDLPVVSKSRHNANEQLLSVNAGTTIHLLANPKAPSPDLIDWDGKNPLKGSVPDNSIHNQQNVNLLDEPMDTFDPLHIKSAEKMPSLKSVDLLSGINLNPPEINPGLQSVVIDDSSNHSNEVESKEKDPISVLAQLTKESISRDIPKKDSQDIRSRTLPRSSNVSVSQQAKHAQSWDAEDIKRVQAKIERSNSLNATSTPPQPRRSSRQPVKPSGGHQTDNLSSASVPTNSWDKDETMKSAPKLLDQPELFTTSYNNESSINTPPQTRRTQRQTARRGGKHQPSISTSLPDPPRISKKKSQLENVQLESSDEDVSMDYGQSASPTF